MSDRDKPVNKQGEHQRQSAYDLIKPDKRSPSEKQYDVLAAEHEILQDKLAACERLIGGLQAESTRLQERAIWYDRLLGNPHLDAGLKVSAYFIWREMDLRLVERRLDGSIPIDVGQLAAESGQGRNTIGRHLRALANMNAIKRTSSHVGRASPKTPKPAKSGKSIPPPKKPQGILVSLSPDTLFSRPDLWRPTAAKNPGGTRQATKSISAPSAELVPGESSDSINAGSEQTTE